MVKVKSRGEERMNEMLSLNVDMYKIPKQRVQIEHMEHISSARLQSYILKLYCHILMTPSQPHENIVDGSTGCQTQPIDGPRSCARYCCNFLVRLKSQKKSLPLLSPLQTNLPSGLTAISHAYPATLCPSNFFLR